MKYYTSTTEFNCGIDLHTRQMYVCVMDRQGKKLARRYLRHVLPGGLRSIRYYGFCHPTAKASRTRVQLHSGKAVQFGNTSSTLLPEITDGGCPPCPRCGQPTQLVFSLSRGSPKRGPPAQQHPQPSTSCLAA